MTLKEKWPSKVPRYSNFVLLDEVFVISGIIEVQVSVISRADGRGW